MSAGSLMLVLELLLDDQRLKRDLNCFGFETLTMKTMKIRSNKRKIHLIAVALDAIKSTPVIDKVYLSRSKNNFKKRN